MVDTREFKILTLVGGISKESMNQKLFRATEKLAPENFKFNSFDIKSLPFFSQDLEADPPKIVRDFRDQIMAADAVLLITPEYNRSFPGVLKNALDWGSRPAGQSKWKKKPAGLMGTTISNLGTFGAQAQLRQVLAYLDMPTVGQPEFYFKGTDAFNDKGELTDEKTKKMIKDYLSALAALAGRV